MKNNKKQKVPLIIPVENQVRELDPKLLLACVAARRGFPSYIGSRREIHFNITRFPKGIYLSKSVTAASEKMFRIMRKLGHKIVAWDEEALVHLPDEIYYSRRLSPKAMANVAHFFAFGEDNAQLWNRYSKLPKNTRIHATGNPRNDLLRSELHAFYNEEVQKIQQAYGNFILVNTNFNHVNAFTQVQNLFQPVEQPGQNSKFGRGATGMPREYAEGLRDHKQAVFETFQHMIPSLHEAFPDHTIVVRPHPTEDHQIYHDIAAGRERLKVTNEGNVVPWLLAAKALIHNGCTTGVEAYVMQIPTITYRASINEKYDFGFYRLPNLLSYPCFSFEELETTLKNIFSGRLNPATAHDREDRKQLIDHYLAAQQGPLACERIVDVLAETVAGGGELSQSGIVDRYYGWLLWALRTVIKRSKDARPRSHNRPEFQRHRYPEVSLKVIQERVNRLQSILNFPKSIMVKRFRDKFFYIYN